MFAFLGNPMLASGVIDNLKQFVSDHHVHPILVNFTAALVPVSLGADLMARVFRRESLRATGFWTLCFAAAITPLTAITGWLFWMPDDVGVRNMTIHKWLGTSLAVAFLAVLAWRWAFHRRKSWPSLIYLLTAAVVVAALIFQGHLGGDQSFGPMTSSPQAQQPHHDPAEAGHQHDTP